MLEDNFSDIEEELTEDDIQSILDTEDYSEFDIDTGDSFLLDIIAPDLDPFDLQLNEEEEEELGEARVLNLQSRIKLSQRMKRNARRFSRIKQIRSKRMATGDRLRYRSRKAALMALRKKAAGRRGMNYNKLSKQQRISIDQIVARRYGKRLSKTVGMYATRILPSVRKKEMSRLSQARNRSVREEFEKREGSPADIKQDAALKKLGLKGDIERTEIDKDMDLHLTPFSKNRKNTFRNLNNSVEISEDETPKINAKFDMLLRLGLVDSKTINRYRAALRGGEKSLANPELRKRILVMLDKMIDVSTKDPSMYNRIRATVQQNARTQKANENLQKKSDKYGIPLETLEEVYNRGMQEHNDTLLAFNRVNSFIAGGFAAELDADLIEKTKCNHSKKGTMCEVHGMKNCYTEETY